jgi:hypothetical protein
MKTGESDAAEDKQRSARLDAKLAGIDLDHEHEDLTEKYQREKRIPWLDARRMARETLHMAGSSHPRPWYDVKRPYEEIP